MTEEEAQAAVHVKVQIPGETAIKVLGNKFFVLYEFDPANQEMEVLGGGFPDHDKEQLSNFFNMAAQVISSVGNQIKDAE